MKIIISILILATITSCDKKQKRAKSIQLPIVNEKVEFKYYNPDFQLDSASILRTDGYYEVTEIFGSFTTNGTDYQTNKPSFGFVHFSDNGFCRVASWNGIRENLQDVARDFRSGKGYVFNGMYQIVSDTIKIEYLYNPASPGAGQSNNRYTLEGLIKNNRIDFLTTSSRRFSYPINLSDSLTSSCIGRFVKAEFEITKWNNYLKDNIQDFIKTE